MTKNCPKCHLELPIENFYQDKTRNTIRPVCKSCTASRGKVWRELNKARKKSTDLNYRASYKDRVATYQKSYYQANKPKYLEAFFRRKAAKLKATPSWLTQKHLEEISYIYSLRQEVNSLSDYEYEVDHIVPLQGKSVCGLHVPWNLQLLPKELNRAKSNSF